MWEDPIVNEVRRVQTEYAAKYNDDIKSICEAARKQELVTDRQVVSLKAKKPKLESLPAK